MLVENILVYEITHVLICKSHPNDYYFICRKYNVVGFDDDFNAIEIKKLDRE